MTIPSEAPCDYSQGRLMGRVIQVVPAPADGTVVKCRGVLALLMFSAGCGSSDSGSARSDGDTQATTVAVSDSDTVYRTKLLDDPLAISRGAAWDELMPTLGPEFADVFPNSGVIGKTWWFETTTRLEPNTISPSADCPQQASRVPGGLSASFAMARPLDPDLYREGELVVTVLHNADPAVVAEYAASQVAVAGCIEGQLGDDTSLVRIRDDLPSSAISAYSIEFDPTGSDENAIEAVPDMTVIDLRRDESVVRVHVSAIQPVAHPEWIDVEHEALRIAWAIDLGT